MIKDWTVNRFYLILSVDDYIRWSSPSKIQLVAAISESNYLAGNEIPTAYASIADKMLCLPRSNRFEIWLNLVGCND